MQQSYIFLDILDTDCVAGVCACEGIYFFILAFFIHEITHNPEFVISFTMCTLSSSSSVVNSRFLQWQIADTQNRSMTGKFYDEIKIER